MSKHEVDRARAALAQGKVGLCEQIANQLLVRNPQSLEAFDLLSRCAAVRRDFPRAVVLAARVLNLAREQPRLKARLHSRIAGYQKMSGSLDEAEKNYRAAIEMDPGHPTHRALFLTFLYDHGRFAEAGKQARGFLKNVSGPVADITAEDYLPIGPALYLVSHLVVEEDLEFFLRVLEDLETGGDHPALRTDPSLFFARASVLDRLKQYPAALGCFHEANRLRRRQSRYDVEPVLRQIQNVSDMFGPEYFALDAGAEVAAGDPGIIFVVGMPRSGTSLVEQVFAAHSEVVAKGESESLSRSVAAAFKQRPGCDPARPETLDDGFFGLIREMYLRAMSVKNGVKFISDKMPLNLMYAWAIPKAFPDAKIVICRRSKPATVLSCFTTNFANRNCFSESLEDCARYFDKVYQSADRWSGLMGDMILHQSYEALVNDPGEQIARLLDHVGLAHEASCFVPHEASRVVNTASRMQVTRPIYKTGNERWEPYLRLLDPKSEVLQ